MLAFALLAGADLGLGIADRISMAHVLRSGAQAAIEDPGATHVTDVMRATASLNFTLDSGSDPLSLSTSRFCACPEDTAVAVTCSTICTGSKETFIYYRMSAQKTHPGWIMPAMTFDPAVQVQIR